MIDAQPVADAPTQAREHNDEIPSLDKSGRENRNAPNTPPGKAHKAGLDNPEPPEATGEKPQGAADRFQVMSGERPRKTPKPITRAQKLQDRVRREATVRRMQAVLDNPNAPQEARAAAQRVVEGMQALLSKSSPRAHQIAVRARREASKRKAQAIVDNPNAPQTAKEKAQRALEMLEAISQPSPRQSDQSARGRHDRPKSQKSKFSE